MLDNKPYDHIEQNKQQTNWFDLGFKHVWRPYTQEKIAPLPLKVKQTLGSKIILEDGVELIDGISSWWSAAHGYNHPYILAQIQKQLEIMPHIMFGGLAHEPAYKLAQRLADITKMDKVFFTDSGSTAVETAMKMAVQYWQNIGHKRKNRFVSFTNSYHGDTMGCMSVCDPESGMHNAFHDYMIRQYSFKLPTEEYEFSEFEVLISDLKINIAAVILEPLVQGAGGMKFHSPDLVAEIYRICKKHDILFIADEVMTGFGRTGHMFACGEAGIIPDIMCIGKALTAGIMPMAATLAKLNIYDAFLGDDINKALMCGPTYMANPLACTAANASLDLFATEQTLKKVEQIESQLYKELLPCLEFKQVVDVRVKGAIAVVELKDMNYQKILKLREDFIKKNIWLRPFDNIIYIMPAFNINPSDLTTITKAILEVLAAS